MLLSDVTIFSQPPSALYNAENFFNSLFGAVCRPTGCQRPHDGWQGGGKESELQSSSLDGLRNTMSIRYSSECCNSRGWRDLYRPSAVLILQTVTATDEGLPRPNFPPLHRSEPKWQANAAETTDRHTHTFWHPASHKMSCIWLIGLRTGEVPPVLWCLRTGRQALYD